MNFVENQLILIHNRFVYNIGGIYMDRITQSMVDAFKKDFNITLSDPSLLFECFANYCVVNSVYGSNDFDS